MQRKAGLVENSHKPLNKMAFQEWQRISEIALDLGLERYSETGAGPVSSKCSRARLQATGAVAAPFHRGRPIRFRPQHRRNIHPALAACHDECGAKFQA